MQPITTHILTPEGDKATLYEDISNITIQNNTRGIGSFNITFKDNKRNHNRDFIYELPVGSLAGITYKDTNVFTGRVNKIPLTQQQSMANVQSTLNISGGGFENIWQNIDHKYIPMRATFIDIDPEQGLLFEGFTFSGPIQELVLKYIYYHFVGIRQVKGKPVTSNPIAYGDQGLDFFVNYDNVYDFTFDPLTPEFHVRDITKQGNLWNMINQIATRPFVENFFTYGTKDVEFGANYHFRPTPYWQTDDIDPYLQSAGRDKVTNNHVIPLSRKFSKTFRTERNANQYYNTYFCYAEALIFDQTETIGLVLNTLKKHKYRGKTYEGIALPIQEKDKIGHFGPRILEQSVPYISGDESKTLTINSITEKLPLWTKKLFQFYFAEGLMREGQVSLPYDEFYYIQPGEYILDPDTNLRYYVNDTMVNITMFGEKPMVRLGISRGIDWDKLPDLYAERLEQLILAKDTPAPIRQKQEENIEKFNRRLERLATANKKGDTATVN